MVGFIRCLNKFLMLPVPLFCLRFSSPEIHNYSNYVLNNSERFLLSLGLNFRPTRILSNHILCKQFDDFVRSVRTKYFFVILLVLIFSHISTVNYMLSQSGLLHWLPLGSSFHSRPLSLSYVPCVIILITIFPRIYLVLNFQLCANSVPLKVSGFWLLTKVWVQPS